MSVKIKGGVFHDGKGKGFTSLSEAQKHQADCGCGTVCDQCYSYTTLKDFNSTTGEFEYKAFHIVDGVFVIDTIENVKASQDAFKALREA